MKDPTFEVVTLSTGELVSDGLTRDQARAKARLMNSVATTEQLVVWRADRSHAGQHRTIKVNTGYLVAPEPEPPKPLGERYDEDLMAEVQAGSNEAFAELHRRYSQALCRYINRRISDSNYAEDICQETFLTVFQSRRKFRYGMFRPWIYIVANNECLQFFEKRRAESKAQRAIYRESAGKAADGGSPLDTLIARERLDWVRVAIAQLPNHHIELLRLRFKDDLRLREMGKAYSSSERALQVRITKSLKALTWFLATTRRRLSFSVTQLGKRFEAWSGERPVSRVDRSQRLGLVQLAILRMALRNRLSGRSTTVDTSGAEILHEQYGFPFADKESRAFNIAEIGLKKWSYARETIKHAARELERRGLVDIERSGVQSGIAGITLTEAGVEMQLELVSEAVQPCR